MNYATKRRYRDPAHPMYSLVNSRGYRWKANWAGYLALNLFALYRWERAHPRRIVPTARYKAWIAQRDASS